MDHPRRVLRDDEGDHLVVGHDVSHQRPCCSEMVVDVRQCRRVGVLPRPAMLPGPLAHALPELALPSRAAVRRVLGAGQGAQLLQMTLYVLVARKPHRLHPAGQGAGPLGPLEQHVGLAGSHRHAQAAHREPTPVPGHHRLQVETAERALPLVQVAEPATKVLQSVGTPTHALGEGRTHVPPTQPHTQRSPLRDPDGREAAPTFLELAPPDGDQRRIETGVDRPPRHFEPSELLGQRIRAGDQGGLRATQTHLGAQHQGLGPHAQGGGACPTEPRPSRPCSRQRPRRIRAQRRTGDRELGLGAALCKVVGSERASRLVERSETTASQTRGHQHLGPILVADRHDDGALGQQDGAYGVHVVQCRDQVALQEIRVALVVFGHRGLDLVVQATEQLDAPGEVRGRSGPGPARKVDAAPVDVRLPELQRVSQQGDRDVERLDRLCGLAGPQQDPRALGVEHTTCLVAEAIVAQGRIAQPQCVLQLAELRSERRLGRVDPSQ